MKKITLITGKIGTGKTQIAIEKGVECLKSNKSVVYFSFEDREENIKKWFIAKSLGKYPDELTKEDAQKMTETDLFSNLFIIHRGIEKPIKNYGLFFFVNLIASSDVIIVDFLQCMGHSKETYDSIIEFAKKYDKEVYVVVSENNNEFTINDANNYDDIIDTAEYFSK